MTNPTSIQTYDQGDILVVFLPYPNQPKPGDPVPSGSVNQGGFWGKRRPVVVVSAAKHNTAQDLLVALVTSVVGRPNRSGEYVLRGTGYGLNSVSAVRPRLYQILKGDVRTKLGKLDAQDRAGLIRMLRDLLAIT